MEAIYDSTGTIKKVYDPAEHRHDGLLTVTLTEEQAANPTAWRIDTTTGEPYLFPASDPKYRKGEGGRFVEMTTEEKAAVDAAEVESARMMLELEVKSRLAEIDRASIRSLREWLAAQPTAPKFIIDHEAAAEVERRKLTAR